MSPFLPTGRLVTDLCAGPGGWEEALAALGYSNVRGLELDTDACDTGRAAGHYRHQCDVAGPMYPSSILSAWGRPVGEVGSPPCPGFSRAGLERGRGDLQLLRWAADMMGEDPRPDAMVATLAGVRQMQQDPRSALALEPLRYALELSPEWLAWEQVPAVLPLWEACARVLERAGYSVATGKLSAEQYGLPQVRGRAILVASRVRQVALPEPTHSRYHGADPGRLDSGVLPWLSMHDVLGWGLTHRPYPALAPGTARGGQDPMMLGGSGARRMLQREVEAGRYLGRDGTPLSGWDLETRRAMRLTVQDAAQLQGFRPDYPWRGTTTQQFRQVGDAVPPPLAAHIVTAAAGLSLEQERRAA